MREARQGILILFYSEEAPNPNQVKSLFILFIIININKKCNFDGGNLILKILNSAGLYYASIKQFGVNLHKMNPHNCECEC